MAHYRHENNPSGFWSQASGFRAAELGKGERAPADASVAETALGGAARVSVHTRVKAAVITNITKHYSGQHPRRPPRCLEAPVSFILFPCWCITYAAIPQRACSSLMLCWEHHGCWCVTTPISIGARWSSVGDQARVLGCASQGYGEGKDLICLFIYGRLHQRCELS